MNETAVERKPRADDAILFALALATLTVHVLASHGYGYFRDELYYIACSKHLAWGYVDQPPFAALMLAICGRLLGYSLPALRFLPAMCGAAVTVLVGLMARELGGNRFAQVRAAVAFMVGGVYLSVSNFYSMNCYDHVFWALAIYILIRILKGGDTRLWLLFGLVAGIGLENKYSMGFLGLGLIVGLALTQARSHFRDRWLWVGGALATLIFLPHVLWEVRNGLPSREFIHNVVTIKNAPMSPWRFLLECTLNVNPFTLPLWLAGLGWLFFSRAARQYRLLGWVWLVVLAILLSTHSKPYYFAPAFLMLFAAGSVAFMALRPFIARHNLYWSRPAYLILLIVTGILFSPFALPILPVETYVRYQTALGIKPGSGERDKPGRLPQMYADMFGWENQAATVAKVYNGLTPEEKARTLIFCNNYGQAGAIDFFGPKYGLPNASSGHNSYWFWGPTNPHADIVITVGEKKEDVEKSFNDVRLAATIVSPYARSFETDIPVYIGRNPKMSLKEIWPRTKGFI
jgi:hypothetical protein